MWLVTTMKTNAGRSWEAWTQEAQGGSFSLGIQVRFRAVNDEAYVR